MRYFILIGGMGSGKSKVLELLADCGAAGVDLDALGHEALCLAQVKTRLEQAFGPDVLQDGQVCRPRLAQLAFASREATAHLNAITHPAIARLAGQRLDALREAGCQLAVLEVSGYAGPGGAFDSLVDGSQGIIAVLASEEVRLARCLARGFTQEDARARMACQPSDAQRAAWARYTLRNEGSLQDLRQDVAALYGRLGA